MVITSILNEKIKTISKLQKKKYRDIYGKYLVEGEHLVLEAIKAGVCLEIFLLEGEEYSFKNITYVTKSVMEKLTEMDSATKMVAVCKKKEFNELVGEKVLLLDGVQDPGNLGTIIRSSVAFGITDIVLSKDTVDLYNKKVLRATQGMYLNVNIIRDDLDKVISILKSKNVSIYGTNVNEGIDVTSLESKDKQKYALIMGNEGQGVSLELQALCDKNLYIKMSDNVESLNVGVACSILLYELGRNNYE